MIENEEEAEKEVPRLRVEHAGWETDRKGEEGVARFSENLVESMLKLMEPVLVSVAVGNIRTEEISGWKRWSGDALPSGNGAAVRKIYGQASAAWRREQGIPNRGVTVSVSEAEPVHGVTVRELDRAVQRDARRYDGQMTLL